MFFPLMKFISSLPTELHDLIKSFLPFPDQINFFYSRRRKFGSRLVEGMEQVEEALWRAVKMEKFDVLMHLMKLIITMPFNLLQGMGMLKL